MHPRAHPAGAGQEEALMRWVRMLADDIGPRRPTGAAERAAAERLRDALEARGLEARLEPFRGHSSFAWPIGAVAAAAVAAALVPRRRSWLRGGLGAGALVGTLAEGDLLGLLPAPSRLLARRASQNVVASIAPREDARRTLCLVCHLDTSRSGLLFHPAVSGHASIFFAALAAACAVQAGDPLAGRRRAGRAVVGTARAVLAAGLLVLAERELRGQEVPGANDNASGVAVATELALACATAPPAHTRVVLLATGCEESGLLGARAFLAAHETAGWLFLNFDSVGGAAPLRYAEREGLPGVMLVDADPGLLRVAARVAAARPELGLGAAPRPVGLTYDTTPVLAAGGRGLTLVAGNGGIPNYHSPADTSENIDRGTLARAFAAGREMLEAIDRGEADLP